VATKPKNTLPPARPRSTSRARALVVLVVDDNTDNREMYIEYLRFVGLRAEGAADGAEAIEAARRIRPAVIIMDLSMPGVDGWKATRILKADPRTSEIPIIAVSSHAEPSSCAQATLAGCDLFVTKPALPRDLAEIVVRLLRRPHAGQSTSG
jgi:CheY-like chemotaxis protein